MKWLVGVIGLATMFGTHAANAQQTTAEQAKAALYAYAKGDDEKVAKVCRVANKNPDIFADGLASKIVSTCILAGISIYYN
ncbi:hypothetical protein LB521_27735 [Mesorhizobium sp. BR-1-1-8]|uniref:hypothetical protein n=1 Tax=Mesorhizobium sp. BR-1-1-8 TaxID=2876659 RepID=UPI001CCD16A0|nr:hypothetical protein [Mesorhizobium sp. BR-1-1-8]MBZ9984929.1 hypothetical protein [Mesorhizobium sp. BR-1-1-8]